ncbi:hypothetical protein AB4Z10_00080 [Bosea sp. RAF48]|uniref:hypothetical protein n=1 Tax=Bosea sp. RAF48 TaxID=3237480 RepID=UPI003F8FCCDB
MNDIASAAHGAIGLRTLSVPAGIKVQARLAFMTAGDSVGAIVAWDPDCGVPTLTFPFVVSHRPVGGQAQFGFTIDVTTNASRQIYTGDGGTNAFLNLYTHGWKDLRDEYN